MQVPGMSAEELQAHHGHLVNIYSQEIMRRAKEAASERMSTEQIQEKIKFHKMEKERTGNSDPYYVDHHENLLNIYRNERIRRQGPAENRKQQALHPDGLVPEHQESKIIELRRMKAVLMAEEYSILVAQGERKLSIA
jgi:superoxide dismutase